MVARRLCAWDKNVRFVICGLESVVEIALRIGAVEDKLVRLKTCILKTPYSYTMYKEEIMHSYLSDSSRPTSQMHVRE